MACRWSPVEPWTWACLSYAGQVSVAAVPKADATEAAWQMQGSFREA